MTFSPRTLEVGKVPSGGALFTVPLPFFRAHSGELHEPVNAPKARMWPLSFSF